MLHPYRHNPLSKARWFPQGHVFLGATSNPEFPRITVRGPWHGRAERPAFGNQKANRSGSGSLHLVRSTGPGPQQVVRCDAPFTLLFARPWRDRISPAPSLTRRSRSQSTCARIVIGQFAPFGIRAAGACVHFALTMSQCHGSHPHWLLLNAITMPRAGSVHARAFSFPRDGVPRAGTAGRRPGLSAQMDRDAPPPLGDTAQMTPDHLESAACALSRLWGAHLLVARARLVALIVVLWLLGPIMHALRGGALVGYYLNTARDKDWSASAPARRPPPRY